MSAGKVIKQYEKLHNPVDRALGIRRRFEASGRSAAIRGVPAKGSGAQHDRSMDRSDRTKIMVFRGDCWAVVIAKSCETRHWRRPFSPGRASQLAPLMNATYKFSGDGKSQGSQ
jgi:hypothetical protein